MGGHCIGVDPYYLTWKAQEIGHHPEIILAGRRINDRMGDYVAGRMVKAMLQKRIPIVGARVLILGLAFKENCPDVRNTRVTDVVRALEDYQIDVDVHDPWVDEREANRQYGVTLADTPTRAAYDGIILAVPHVQFRDSGPSRLRAFGKGRHVFFDMKSVFSQDESDLRL